MRPIRDYLSTFFALPDPPRRLYVDFGIGGRAYSLPALTTPVPNPTLTDAQAWGTSSAYNLKDRQLMASSMLNCAAVGWGPETGWRITAHTDALGPRAWTAEGANALISRIRSFAHPAIGTGWAAAGGLVLSMAGLRNILAGGLGHVLVHHIAHAVVPQSTLNVSNINEAWRLDPQRCTVAPSVGVLISEQMGLDGLISLQYAAYDGETLDPANERIRAGTLLIYGGPGNPAIRWGTSSGPAVAAAASSQETFWLNTTSWLGIMPVDEAAALKALGVRLPSALSRYGVGTMKTPIWDFGIRLCMAPTTPLHGIEVSIRPAEGDTVAEWMANGGKWLSRQNQPRNDRDSFICSPVNMIGRTMFNLVDRQDGGGPGVSDSDKANIAKLKSSTLVAIGQFASRARAILPTSEHSVLKEEPSSFKLAPANAAHPALTRASYDAKFPGRNKAYLMSYQQCGPAGGGGDLWISPQGAVWVFAPGMTGWTLLTIANAQSVIGQVGSETLYTKSELSAVALRLSERGASDLADNVTVRPDVSAEATGQPVFPQFATASKDDWIAACVALVPPESFDFVRTLIGLRDAERALWRQVLAREPDMVRPAGFYNQQEDL